MDLKLRPAYSFEEFKKQVSPNTAHTTQTYCAFQIPAHYVPAEIRREGVGAVFRVPRESRREVPAFGREEMLRITAVNENWVYAVPSTYVDKFWE